MARPYKFTNARKLKDDIDKYFNTTSEEQWTVTGLCMTLECDRETILNYEKLYDNEEHSEKVGQDIIRLIKNARMKVHNGYEIDLRKRGGSGAIFALKNFGWKDTFEHEGTGFTPTQIVINNANERDKSTS
jgi:hypothetical protein